MTAVAGSPADFQRVFIRPSNGRGYVASNAPAGKDATWTDRSLGLPLRSVTSLAADPLRPDVAYAGVSGFSGFDDVLGHVFKTIDGGVSWRDISSNLPNIPVNAVVQDLDSPGTIF